MLPLKVSDNKRFLVTRDGKPFFWLGDTAWELFHRLNREEAAHYLRTRSDQGFTVIQAVAIPEVEGPGARNAYGKLPLADRDPARPAVTPGADPRSSTQYDWWDHVDYVVSEAERRGLRIALLPTWASWVSEQRGRVFTERNAVAYGEFLGKRYGDRVIWVLGGDRNPNVQAQAVWRALARGIAVGATGREDYGPLLMTFHPTGGSTSSTWFHRDAWLDVNMHQTGHSPAHETRGWEKIAADYAREPVKPVLDGEPLYEDHPLGFNANANGYSFDAHVRQRAYWHVFAGAFGHTYGNHAVWQMASPKWPPINGPLMHWRAAILRPGAAQMRHVRDLVESRPFLSRVPAPEMVADRLAGSARVEATRGDGYAMVYSGEGRPFTLTLGSVSGQTLKAWWFNPRTGVAAEAGEVPNTGSREFRPPSLGFGSDWVLVLDDAARGYGPPGRPQP